MWHQLVSELVPHSFNHTDKNRTMVTIIGIDPGAKYTGVVVREGDEVLLASTYVRPEEIPPITWASTLALYIIRDVIWLFPDALIGIEGISDPKGYSRGKLSPINPKYLIRAGITLGVVAGVIQTFFPDSNFVVIPPKNNGSRHISMYPECLSGRRPKELPGSNNKAGTRNHEKSAYDVAGEVERRLQDGYTLDEMKSEFVTMTEYDKLFAHVVRGNSDVHEQVDTVVAVGEPIFTETVVPPAKKRVVKAKIVEVVVVDDDYDNPLGLPPEAHTKSRKPRTVSAKKPRRAKTAI